METTNIKEEAKRLIERLPENCTWDDLRHQIYVRQAIEAGLDDSEKGRTSSVEEVPERFSAKSDHARLEYAPAQYRER